MTRRFALEIVPVTKESAVEFNSTLNGYALNGLSR
jgi:hypothetical protein